MVKYNPRHEQNYKRRCGYRSTKQSFLIICEGVNTEPDYFNAFRLTSASVKAVGKGRPTRRVVERAWNIGFFFILICIAALFTETIMSKCLANC